ncbi:efflux RND transporter periplasmic adaptor subunit, partial [Aquisalinus luteolus]|uniref:efflux RND transporter periplasmic adaptor subunit n=1 Tax=Aquisalinus luteolus TaxID=1566827 RepID=UPI001E468407
MMVLVFGIPLLSSCGEETAETGAQADHAAHEEDSHEEDDDEHGHEDEADIVEMSQSAAKAAGISLAKAELQKTSDDLELPAEIRTNPDRVANLSSPVSGIVTKLMVSEGDRVTAGQPLAVISSRELADLKAEYLASVSAEDLARTDLAREEKLYADQITAEADLLNARAASRKASAARESSETKLHALGIGHDVIDRLASAPDGSLSQFTLGAPIPGQIIRRDLTHGQSVDAASAEPLIVIVDTSTVWADITV